MAVPEITPSSPFRDTSRASVQEDTFPTPEVRMSGLPNSETNQTRAILASFTPRLWESDPPITEMTMYKILGINILSSLYRATLHRAALCRPPIAQRAELPLATPVMYYIVATAQPKCSY